MRLGEPKTPQSFRSACASTSLAGDKRTLQSLTLVIDENPAPVAGTFTIGPHSGVTSISTRVRVNSYSYVRVVAELSDGQLYGVKAYVKASGGCSAPAAANADATKSMLGQMKFRTFHSEADGLPEAQIMLRHPQNSGLQMDQLTRLYVPPFFIENLKIWQGDDLVMAMDGGIAISEDPNIRFNYKPNGAANFRAEAIDTSKDQFKDEWLIEKSMLSWRQFLTNSAQKQRISASACARRNSCNAALACSVDRNSEPTGPVTWDIEIIVSAAT